MGPLADLRYKKSTLRDMATQLRVSDKPQALPRPHRHLQSEFMELNAHKFLRKTVGSHHVDRVRVRSSFDGSTGTDNENARQKRIRNDVLGDLVIRKRSQSIS